MTKRPFHKVCFVGAGTMGCFNSMLAALAGYEAVIYDISQDTLDTVSTVQHRIAKGMVDIGLLDGDKVATAIASIKCETDLAIAVQGAGLVSESVYEDISLKQQIFSQLESVCDDHTLLTTNSSALLISDIEKPLKSGENVAALHSHLGAMLFDIVAGPRSHKGITQKLQDYVHSLGGVPLVLKKEYKGYVFNAMIGPVLASSLKLVTDGVATIKEVDKSWMQYHSAPMGPFGMMDMFGLNLIYDGWNKKNQDQIDVNIQREVLSFLAPIVGAGRLGMKSGQGFYSYPNPAYSRSDFFKSIQDNETANYVLTGALTSAACLIASHDVLTPSKIDQAWKVATRLNDGPFEILARHELDKIPILFGPSMAAMTPENQQKLTEFINSNNNIFKTNREFLREKK